MLEQVQEFDDQAIEAFVLLMHEFWILRAKQPRDYQLVREREKVLRRYLDEKFGLLLIVHPHFIKLEKIPVEPEIWMGIADFQEKRDYVLFCCAMAFLEEKSPREQFLLSELSEEIRLNHPGEEGVDWTVYTHRKSLIRTIKMMAEFDLIRTVDGNIKQFDTDQEQEVLYETTVYSKYFIRSFPEDLTAFTKWQDMLEEEWRFQQEDERRKRVYRKLFFSPGVHRDPDGDQDFLYIRNFRNRLQEDIEKHSHYELKVFKNTALLSAADPDYRHDIFPDTKAVTDVLLHLSWLLREKYDTLTRLESGDIMLTEGGFDQLIAELRQRTGEGWSKYFREASIETVRNECLSAMKSWTMAETSEDNPMIYIKPLFGLLAGKYPDDYTGKDDDND